MNSTVLRWAALGLLTIAAVGCCMTGSSGTASYQSSDGRYKYSSSDLDASAGVCGFNKENYHYHWFLMAADGTCYERIEYCISKPSVTGKPVYLPWPLPRFPHRLAGQNGYTEEYGYYVRTTILMAGPSAA